MSATNENKDGVRFTPEWKHSADQGATLEVQREQNTLGTMQAYKLYHSP